MHCVVQITLSANDPSNLDALDTNFKVGTGAVAPDKNGVTNKRFGRIGDSPIIGAGTYADNASCAVSATGHEIFVITWPLISVHA